MRLTLAEVAQCICTKKEDIVWHECKTTSFDHCAVPYSVLPALKVEMANNGIGIESIYARWASDMPGGGEIDSRLVRPGDIFFCLPGAKVDGHDFALTAAQAGAVAIVAVRNPFASLSEDFVLEHGACLPPVFLVPDVAKALQRLSMNHRDTTIAKVVGITGTAGKTSVKEVLAHVLSIRGITAKNHKNRNNQLGLPVSMLKANADASFWVMEAGISQPHDMQELGIMIRPDVALVLNVGTGHTEGLGDKGVAHYKAQLFDYVQSGGLVVYNADFPDLCQEVQQRRKEFAKKKITTMGFSTQNENCQVFVQYAGMDEEGNGIFHVKLMEQCLKFTAPFISRYGAENVAAIVCVAKSLGFCDLEIRKGLESAKLPEQRFAAVEQENYLILDDSYNANPLSAKRMLDAAKEIAVARNEPLYVIFGEMKELGSASTAEHIFLGEHLGRLAPRMIFWKGGKAQEVRAGLELVGYAGEFYPVGGGQEFTALLEELDMPSGVVLFKGSRSNNLENLVAIFKGYLSSVELPRV